VVADHLIQHALRRRLRRVGRRRTSHAPDVAKAAPSGSRRGFPKTFTQSQERPRAFVAVSAWSPGPADRSVCEVAGRHLTTVHQRPGCCPPRPARSAPSPSNCDMICSTLAAVVHRSRCDGAAGFLLVAAHGIVCKQRSSLEYSSTAVAGDQGESVRCAKCALRSRVKSSRS
jgi:hypothetical protein